MSFITLMALLQLTETAVAQSARDSAAVVAVVESYHRALAEADSAAALRLMTADALTLESGEVESKREYRSHHLPADIGFARAVKGTHEFIRVSVRGDVAWTTATSTTRGRYRGKSVSSKGAELVVLTRTTEGWKISAIHWSSHPSP